ncbi:MAG: bifunctional DNA primase/polymerase, partial [bacterium]
MGRSESGTTSSFLESALSYTRMGYAVIPLPAGEKSPPRIKNWTERWTKDEDQVREWWQKWPESNIGIVCGEPSNLVVLDVDGPEGHRALRGHHLPDTVQVTTGKDEGTHYWFRYDPDELDVDISNKVRMYDQ